MDAPHGRLVNAWRKNLTAITQEYCELFERVLETTPNKTAALWPPTTHQETIQIRRTRHAGHCWRSKDEFISDILPCIPSHGWAKVGQPARINIQQLCADTGCGLEDLLGTMDDKDSEIGSGRSMLAVRHDDDCHYCTSAGIALVLDKSQRLICNW